LQADARSKSPSPAVAEDEVSGEVPESSASDKKSVTPKTAIREKKSTEKQKKSAKKDLVIIFHFGR